MVWVGTEYSQGALKDGEGGRRERIRCEGGATRTPQWLALERVGDQQPAWPAEARQGRGWMLS